MIWIFRRWRCWRRVLLEFPGALVLVTHDRYMLDRVSNVVLGLDGRGNAAKFADYAQWEEWKEQGIGNGDQGVEKPTGLPASTQPVKGALKKKLVVHGAAGVRRDRGAGGGGGCAHGSGA